MADIIKS